MPYLRSAALLAAFGLASLSACSTGTVTTTTVVLGTAASTIVPAQDDPATAPTTSTSVTPTTEVPPEQGGSCPPVTATFTGAMQDPALTEISGIAASRSQPGVLWVHNDSGDGPLVYAAGADGALLAAYELEGAAAEDWEDMAIGPGPQPGTDYLYLGDIGDNPERRPTVTVYRVAEPVAPDAPASTTLALDGVEAFDFTYPDEPHDVETLLVDPVTGDVFLVTKQALGASRVFRAAAPLQNGAVLEEVARLRLGIGGFATGGDVSPAGDRVAIRTYVAVLVWPRADGECVAEALDARPCIVTVLNEAQGEGVGFTPDGSGLYTVTEGAGAPIQLHDLG